MIGRAAVRLLAAVIAAVLWPVAVWDQWHTRHPGEPWDTE